MVSDSLGNAHILPCKCVAVRSGGHHGELRSGEKMDERRSFRRPCFQRGEAWENAKIAGRPNFVPKNLWNKWRFELAKHMYRIWTPLGFGTSKAQLKNSKHNMCLVGTKFREENDDDARKFALIGGRCWGGYEQNTQQSTIKTFSCTSQACISVFLGGLGDCGSHGIASRQRPFFACSNTG